MATTLPPLNKRQKVDADNERRQQTEDDKIPEGLGSVRVQFVDQSTGSATGGPVSIPIQHGTVKNLEQLLNSLREVSCRVTLV